jgi:GNAT superfamily N-acetyltransferase
MPIHEIAPEDEAGRRRFIRLERDLHGHEPSFVSAIDADEDSFLSGRSPLNAGIEHALFMASNGGDVARCGAFVNERFQQHHGEPLGSVGHFAAAPESENEAHELISLAEEWLGRRGVTRVIAPYSSLGEFGLRVAEFDTLPLTPFRWHPPYYASYFEDAGYHPTYKWWSFRVDFRSDRYREASQRALREPNCRVRPLDKRRWEEELQLIADMFNRTFRDEWEFYPLTVEEWRGWLDPLKPLIDPRQFLIAEIDGEPAGICLGLMDVNNLMKRANGKIGLIAQLRFALRARRARWAGLWVIGVLPELRGKRIGQTLAATLYRRYEELGLEGGEYHIVNDENTGSRALAQSFGGEGRILYHNYDRRLD